MDVPEMKFRVLNMLDEKPATQDEMFKRLFEEEYITFLAVLEKLKSYGTTRQIKGGVWQRVRKNDPNWI